MTNTANLLIVLRIVAVAVIVLVYRSKLSNNSSDNNTYTDNQNHSINNNQNHAINNKHHKRLFKLVFVFTDVVV
jgi:hypothetical protein